MVIKSLFAAWNLKASLLALAILAALLAAAGGYGYHRGAISQAKEVGELNGKINKLEADVSREKGTTAACEADITEQNKRLDTLANEAAKAKKEAVVAAARARLLAKKQRERVSAIISEPPSASCDEEAERIRDDLRQRRERAK